MRGGPLSIFKVRRTEVLISEISDDASDIYPFDKRHSINLKIKIKIKDNKHSGKQIKEVSIYLRKK